MTSARDLPLLFSNCTDVGKIREKNEDFLGYFRKGRRHLFVVADGMGGEKGGQQASRTAVSEVEASFEENSNMNPVDLLRGAVRTANEACVAIQEAHPEFKGMGTTLELLLVEGNLAWWAHVGDSRIYLIREDGADQLTVDHSRVQQMLEAGLITEEEAVEHPHRHVLSRVVGHSLDLEPDVTVAPLELKDGDALLLCSDGLCDLVTDDEMAWVVSKFGPQRACRRLVDIALERGGHDNTTVQVLYKGKAKKSWGRIKTAAEMPNREKKQGTGISKKLIASVGAVILLVLIGGFLLRDARPEHPGEVSPEPSIRVDMERMARIRNASGAVEFEAGELDLDAVSTRLMIPSERTADQEADILEPVTDSPIVLYSVQDVRELDRADGPASILDLNWTAPELGQELLVVIPFRLERALEEVFGTAAIKTLVFVKAHYSDESENPESRGWTAGVDKNGLEIQVQIEGKQPKRQATEGLGEVAIGEIHVLFVMLGTERSWIAIDDPESIRELEEYAPTGKDLARLSMRWVSELGVSDSDPGKFEDEPAISVHDILFYDSFSTDDEKLAEEIAQISAWFGDLAEFKRSKFLDSQDNIRPAVSVDTGEGLPFEGNQTDLTQDPAGAGTQAAPNED